MKNRILQLTGNRWFNKNQGNTYFSAVAHLDGKEIAKIDYAYGYGDHCIDELLKLVVVDQYSIGKGSKYDFFRLLENDLNVTVITTINDVKRKKDLTL